MASPVVSGSRPAGATPAAAPTQAANQPLRLSEGSEEPALQPAATPAPAERLSDPDLQQVLARLPAFPPVPGEAQEFALPPTSMPAPRAGQTITTSFPPPVSRPAPESVPAGPLEVLRHAPEGDVPLAPYLSIAFNQPMVPLTSIADVAAISVPVKLAPLPPGDWRWVGTKNLMFEPKAASGTGTGRFPMATKYTAEIPAGTTSATGGTLAEAVSWTFTTPPPQLQSYYPEGSPQRLDPLMFASFDQRIDPDAVLPTVKASAGRTPVSLRLATEEEVRADKTVRHLAERAGEGRWLAFRAAEPFPADTEVRITIGPGTPSAEGPLKTETAQPFSFRTYGPLKVTGQQCGWERNCPPLAPWTIEFSNPLDVDAFQKDQVQVDPELPSARIFAMGNQILIQGRSRGRTTYTVHLSGSLLDQFVQTLGTDQSVTFSVGTAQPSLTAPGGALVVLDPTGKPTYSVYSVNYNRLKLQVYEVQPEDWPAFKTYLREVNRQGTPPTPPGRQILSKTIPVEAKQDELVETAIDLGPVLKNGLGQRIVIIQPDITGLAALFGSGRRVPVIRTWVQATQIGLDAFADNDNLVAWANSLADGAPLNGVQLSLAPAGGTATTGDAGTATLPLPAGDGASTLVARLGPDVAMLPAYPYPWGDGSWQHQPQSDSLRWYVFDDRGIYRPGEQVHIKGWIRRIGAGTTGDVGFMGGVAKNVAYTLHDGQGNQIATGTAPLNAWGGFDFSLALPETMNLGDAYVELHSDGPSDISDRSSGHQFQVQEFRRPEFEVKASASEGPFMAGGHAIAEVSATYYAGGGLPNADVTWQVTSAPGHYSPPGWSDFTFGKWVPWWISAGPAVLRSGMPGRFGPGGPEGDVETYTGRTGAAGVHRLRLDFGITDPPEPRVYTAEASVMDVNRQAWNSAATMLVHPADLYVGLRSERTFVQREEPLRIDLIVTDLDGKPVAGQPIAARAARLDWQYKDGTWQEVEAAVQTCKVESAAEPVQCTFETPEGGTYRISAVVVDDQGRANQSEITRWVSGGQRPSARQVEQEQVTLIPDRKEYQPGDTAEILVQAPFSPAEGLLTLRRSGMVSSERFTMSGPSTTLRIPIDEKYIPNLGVQVDLVGSAPRTDDAGQLQPDLPRRPAFATGQLNLAVPPLARTLTVDVSPRDKKVEPGGKTVVDVTVRDAKGNPVPGAEVALVVVDESVLALTNYQMADPISIFYSDRSPDVGDYHTRSNILLANPETLVENQVADAALSAESAGGRGMVQMAPSATMAPAPAAMEKAAGGAQAPAIAVRSNFDPLATFAPSLPTDAQGRAQVEVKVPDNLTRYRVMAVAVSGETSPDSLRGKAFGQGESSITARLPLMVRVSPPRFLNFGDRFELPVVIQNQTDAPMQVDVAVQASNVELTAGQGRRLTVPANDRREVRFPAATARAGLARFQVGAVGSADGSPVQGAADAAKFELPVWTPATTEAFAVYGQIDNGAIAQPVIAPSGVFTQFGGLEITTSSTAVQELTDAVMYLIRYPFECTEQIASRVLGIAALRDVLSAFKASGLPSPAEIEASMARDIAHLQALQNDDGGFPVWQHGEESWPYFSVHAAHALIVAKQKGYVVSAESLDKSQQYLRNIERSIPSWYGPDARRALIAYALNVRQLMGDADPTRARQLIAEAGSLDNLSLEAIGWILPVLSGDPASASQVAAIRQHLANRATETAGAANFVSSYGDDDYLLLRSDRRADGIILDALIGDQPQSDLIPKLVRGLLANRTAGRWMNTQENAFILLALDRYFNTYEAQTPDFVARAWLGDTYAGEAAFRGRTTEYRQIDIPMAYLAQNPGPQELTLDKEGTGRLYYRLGMSYAPTDLNMPPADAGFSVERTYEAVDHPDDVRRDADGTWHVKAGARVRVRLSMVAPSRRYHVALVDPMPAGFEALNPALAVTGSVPKDPQSPDNRYGWWWSRPWYEHQNLRDDRAEAFTSLLWDGVYNYSYVARATTPGSFIAPPAKAEEMYAPETFGRSAVDRVVVE